MRKFFAILLMVLAMGNAYTANQYINDVLSGKQIVCKWVRLAVERHVADLKKQNTEEFPYWFDEATAKRVIDFKQLLKHTKGEWANPQRDGGNFIKLEPWQQFKDWVLFGWKRADGYRRFRTAFICEARKNGKTADAAATGNYCVWADRPVEFGAEGYCVATKRDQAKISWNDACRQVKANETLSKVIKNQTGSMFIPGTASRFIPLGQDSKTEDGLNPHFVLVDEYHAHPDDGMINVMTSGMGARMQPLTYIITTAGFDINSPCRLEQEKAEKVLEGSIKDETYFALIYTLDEKDDWTNPKVWIKANPNLGVSVYESYLVSRCKTARDMPSKQNDFKVKNMNVWTQAQKRWITHDKWLACGGEFDEAALVGRTCYGGLDLSTSLDITAYVLCFPPSVPEEKYKFLYRFFLPEEEIVERGLRDRIDYKMWVDQGLITLTPGNVIDYDYIEEAIKADSEKYNLREIAYDPWKAQEIVNHCQGFGIEMIPIFQRYSGMAVPTQEFEKAVMSPTLLTNGNPVMTWMISCTEVKSDRQGNIMPMKPERDKAGKRIDGVVASIMAYYRALAQAVSPYETQGVFAI